MPSSKRPQVLLIQEHKLTNDEAIGDARSFGSLLGYTSIWTKAGFGPGGKPSGGTAILAIAQLGLVKPKLPQGTQVHSRATMGIIQPPTFGRLMLFSAYGISKLGTKGENLELATSIPMVAAILGLPFLAGGDFNMNPPNLKKTGMPKKSSTVIVAPDRSTCVTKSWSAGTTIDFFM